MKSRKCFFQCTLFKGEITELCWFRSLPWTPWDSSEPQKPQHPAVIPRIQGHSNARIRLESGLHETLPQEGSCAHHGIPAPGAAQIPPQAGQGSQPGEPGMSLLSPPCSRRSRWAQPLSSQQGDLPGSGMCTKDPALTPPAPALKTWIKAQSWPLSSSRDSPASVLLQN